MDPPQQVAHALLESLIAVSAAEASGRAKIAERRGAKRATRGVALRSLHLLVHALKEIADVRLGSGQGGFNATLGGAPLAEVEQPHSTSLDFGELDDRVRFLAHIAHHASKPSFAGRTPVTSVFSLGDCSYDDVADNRLTQYPTFEQQHSPCARGETSVMSDDDHTDFKVIHDLTQ